MLKKFKAAKKSLGNLDTEAAAELIAAAADIVLIIDKKGVICDVAFGSDDLSEDIPGEWLGRAWPDTVTLESRLDRVHRTAPGVALDHHHDRDQSGDDAVLANLVTYQEQ